MKKLAVIACISTALAATSATALTLTEMSSSIDACFTKGEVDSTVAALESTGWQRAPRPLPEATAEQLIWPQALFYITGDSGGEALKSIVELQRRTVTGLAAKKDIPTSKTRILSRQLGDKTESVLLLWQIPSPGLISVICRFALSSASLSDPQGALATPYPKMDQAPNQTLNITSLNSAKIAAAIAGPMSVSGVVQTQHRFQLEVAQ